MIFFSPAEIFRQIDYEGNGFRNSRKLGGGKVERVKEVGETLFDFRL